MKNIEAGMPKVLEVWENSLFMVKPREHTIKKYLLPWPPLLKTLKFSEKALNIPKTSWLFHEKRHKFST